MINEVPETEGVLSKLERAQNSLSHCHDAVQAGDKQKFYKWFSHTLEILKSVGDKEGQK